MRNNLLSTSLSLGAIVFICLACGGGVSREAPSSELKWIRVTDGFDDHKSVGDNIVMDSWRVDAREDYITLQGKSGQQVKILERVYFGKMLMSNLLKGKGKDDALNNWKLSAEAWQLVDCSTKARATLQPDGTYSKWSIPKADSDAWEISTKICALPQKGSAEQTTNEIFPDPPVAPRKNPKKTEKKAAPTP